MSITQKSTVEHWPIESLSDVSEAAVSATSTSANTAPVSRTWSLLGARLTTSRLASVAYSLADQGFAVGGVFLINVMLARAQTKPEYGAFVLSYSVYTFLNGVYNAVILEPYTVFGAGRYRDRYSQYLRLMLRSSAVVGLLLTASLLCSWVVLKWISPSLASGALAGLGLTISILLSATFLRRAFYVQRQPALASRTSLVFLLAVTCGLGFAKKAHVLDGFSVFLILALGWVVAGAVYGSQLQIGNSKQAFLESEPAYWQEHWSYSRWVVATAAVYQFTTQGYYWLVAGVLSVREVAELRATYLLVMPVEQVFIAISFLVLPALASHYASRRMDRVVSLWKKNALAVFGLTAVFALGVRFFGKMAIHIVYAGKFDGLAPLLYLLAFSPMLIGIAGTMVNALNSAEKPKLVFCGFLASGAVTFLVGIPLVTRYGLRGAAFGVLASGGTLVAVLGALYFLHVHQPARRAILCSKLL